MYTLTKDDSHAGHGIPVDKYELFHTNMCIFNKHVLQWLPWEQQRITGSKLSLIQSLDIIADTITHTPRPITTPIALPFTGNPKNWRKHVLKRGYSGFSDHVHLSAEKFLLNITVPKEMPGCQWFAQTYIKLLRKFGKWRVVIVEGAIMYYAFTYPVPGGFECKITSPQHTLEEMSYVFPVYLILFQATH